MQAPSLSSLGVEDRLRPLRPILLSSFVSPRLHATLNWPLTTRQGFLAAHRRFAGRRGVCATIRSDCGTNLVGADAELKRLFEAASQDFSKLRNLLTSDGTDWQFNPPSALHVGGKWEAAVKSAKFHILRAVGETILTYEEFSTVSAQIEGLLISRPLCPLTDDPSDLTALTPGHFLTGGPINAPPEPSLEHLPISKLSKWQRVRKLSSVFGLDGKKSICNVCKEFPNGTRQVVRSLLIHLCSSLMSESPQQNGLLRG